MRDILPGYRNVVRNSVENFTWHNAGRKLLQVLKDKNLYI